ncbi:MAG: sensor domain-containing diguanylate cyclase [Gammaproteobacteria bacterium]|nr:sensor domain-containing diguanylate cyclase [Gammaproteobacteria bacterium]
MIEPPLPLDETTRLMSLHSLRILDTHPEERFDRITRMAQRMFGVEICLISLVDSQRQWFKSKQGLDACETPRNISFCGHAILSEEVMVITDAATDSRFADNPLVTDGPNIRFYAGCPIRGPDRHRIGTLCLIDPAPRDFSADDQLMLQDLAQLVEDELALLSQTSVDDLTRVSNRLGFNTIARHMLSLCRRTGTDAELVFFDLDGFKAVNDRFGHAAGDKLLKIFAKMLTQCFRSTDVVARLGGDEFVVLMTGTNNADAALQRLEKLARAQSSTIDGELLWSVGRVVFEAERHETLESMLADADSRMYEDKVNRRRTGS